MLKNKNLTTDGQKLHYLYSEGFRLEKNHLVYNGLPLVNISDFNVSGVYDWAMSYLKANK